MKALKYSAEGKQIGEVELPPSIFNSVVSEGAIYDAIKAENANLRSGNHSTKDRSEVSGGGKKPWAQKGTGRARQGSSRAPHWTGGGIVHGPKKRDYSIKLSRNVKRKAVVSILNKKASDSRIKIIEDLKIEEFSTKKVFNVFKNLEVVNAGAFALVISGESKHLKVSSRNIPTLKYINSKRIACRDLLYNNNIIITEGALNEIIEQYKGVNKNAS
ncbi:MAG: 50S ribosomal protein L4 [Leptospiraceae bacterium]|nr:50S ribosomal protein L4 [Leptospiraceae bacterium]